MIIDFHTHIFPDDIAKKAIPTLAARSGIKPAADGTALNTATVLRAAGFDKAVALNIATKPKQTPVINDWIVTLVSDEMFIPFGTIHPEYTQKEAEFIKLSKAGVKGIKIHPDYQNVFANDDILNEIYELAVAYNMTVIFHAGVDIGLPEPIHCTPKMLAEVSDNFPSLRIVAAHYGGYLMWDDVIQYYKNRENIFIDTAFSVGRMDNTKRNYVINSIGVDRILLASDCPWENPQDSVKSILKLSISDDSKEKILGGNAARLLHI